MSDGRSSNDVLEVESLQITDHEALNTVRSLYDVDARDIERLDGYDSKNFRVICHQDKNYLLKISNSVDSRRKPFLEMQNSVMMKLLEHGIPVPCPLRSKGDLLIEYQHFRTVLDTSGRIGDRAHAARLFTFLDGTPLASPEISLTKELMFNVGRMVAVVDQLLTKECHEFFGVRYLLEWTFEGMSEVRKKTFVIEDEGTRELVVSALHRFDVEIAPIMNNLTAAVIHGDANGGNILVSGSQVSGLVDWEECGRSCAIFELAILCSYVLSIHTPERCPDFDPVETARHCVDGYCSVWNLPQWELRLLPTLILARNAQSLCLSLYTYRMLDPDNDSLLSDVQDSLKTLKLYQGRLSDRLDRICLSGTVHEDTTAM